jgi:hypothetical protein
MNLPIPKPEEVTRLTALYERKFGVILTDAEALEVTTKALQLYYVLRHVLKGPKPH